MMPPLENKMADMRAEYQALVGKRPFMGWGAAELSAKIEEAKR